MLHRVKTFGTEDNYREWVEFPSYARFCKAEDYCLAARVLCGTFGCGENLGFLFFEPPEPPGWEPGPTVPGWRYAAPPEFIAELIASGGPGPARRRFRVSQRKLRGMTRIASPEPVTADRSCEVICPVHREPRTIAVPDWPDIRNGAAAKVDFQRPHCTK